MYKYKITDQDSKVKQFQDKRIVVFDQLESKLDEVKKLLRQSKIETIKYYRENPESYAVVKGTDLTDSYLDDIIDLLQ